MAAKDFEAVERLRYRAYSMKGVLPLGVDNLVDEMDFDLNAMVFGVYLDGELASTMRLHVVTPERRTSQSGLVFPEAVDGLLSAGLVLVDSARFAVAPEMAGEVPELPLLTIRLSPMAVVHFAADMALQPVRPAHAGFYRRYCLAKTVVPPTMVAAYGFELTLLASATREIEEKVMERTPLFRSTPEERIRLFSLSPWVVRQAEGTAQRQRRS